jgi:hydroxymethylglutaryl-CoA reductase (NADPH)
MTEPLTPRDGDEAPLVPRFDRQGYGDDAIAARRRWAEERTGATLAHVGGLATPGEELRGNVENPVGAAQVPLGLAGPLRVLGEHARGVFYVPLATTEGALVRSYERGMTAITRAGGATARVLRDENRACPAFLFADLDAATAFARSIPGRLEEIRAVAEATTRHGRLLRAEAAVVGCEVLLSLAFSTGEASGMNLVARAADAVCRALLPGSGARRFLLLSGAEGEKRPGGALLAGGKGKTVVAAVRLPARLVRAYLHTKPGELAELWRATVVGNLQAGGLGYGGQLANGLAALFVACGQDVANVVNAAVGVTVMAETPEGDLDASVTLPSLTVGTVGGGTGLGTDRASAACARRRGRVTTPSSSAPASVASSPPTCWCARGSRCCSSSSTTWWAATAAPSGAPATPSTPAPTSTRCSATPRRSPAACCARSGSPPAG